MRLELTAKREWLLRKYASERQNTTKELRYRSSCGRGPVRVRGSGSGRRQHLYWFSPSGNLDSQKLRQAAPQDAIFHQVLRIKGVQAWLAQGVPAFLGPEIVERRLQHHIARNQGIGVRFEIFTSEWIPERFGALIRVPLARRRRSRGKKDAKNGRDASFPKAGPSCVTEANIIERKVFMGAISACEAMDDIRLQTEDAHHKRNWQEGKFASRPGKVDHADRVFIIPAFWHPLAMFVPAMEVVREMTFEKRYAFAIHVVRFVFLSQPDRCRNRVERRGDGGEEAAEEVNMNAKSGVCWRYLLLCLGI